MAGGLWCFALLEPRSDARSHCGPGPRRFPGRVAFLLLRPRRGRSLTVSLWTRATLPALGRVAFFCSRPGSSEKRQQKQKNTPGGDRVVFFSVRPPPRRSLTYCEPGPRRFPAGWWFFFWLRPRRTRRASNKESLVYYIGSKKTRRGNSQKKATST